MSVSTHFNLLKFSMVGAIGLLLDITVLYAVADWLGWYGARLLSFVCAASVTWSLNRRYTFHHINHPNDMVIWGSQYLKYLLSMTLGGTLNYLVYIITLYYLPVFHAPMAGVALGSLAGLALNFSLAQSFVFKQTALVDRQIR